MAPDVDLSEAWPSAGQLDSYYDNPDDELDILDLSISGDHMVVGSAMELGPGKTSAYTPGVPPTAAEPGMGLLIDTATGDIVKLAGTLLVTGNLDAQDGTIDLNNQVLYVRGDITVGTRVEFTGSGVIIALGAVVFQPNIVAGDAGDASIILHYNGTTWMGMDNPDMTMADLNDVWGTSASNVYAVANMGKLLHYYDPPSASKPLHWYYYNAGAPTAVYSDSSLNLDPVMGATGNLNGIWGSATDNIFVIGDQATILHYYDPDGTGSQPLAWRKVDGINSMELLPCILLLAVNFLNIKNAPLLPSLDCQIEYSILR